MRSGNGRRLVALARVGAAALVVLTSITALAISKAASTLGESLATFGNRIAELTTGHANSAIGLLDINGLDLRYMTVSTPFGIEEVLDRVQRMCAEQGGVTPLHTLLDATRASVTPRSAALLHGIYRKGGETDGVIACLDTGAPLDIAEFLRRLRAFAETGDLSAIGGLRYAIMRREGRNTSVLVLWSEGKAPLLRMFPGVGDAPGKDPAGVPRPLRSTRLLSASMQGSPYGIAVYRVRERSPTELCRWYHDQMSRLGWATQQPRKNNLVARRDGQTLVIRVAAESTDEALVSIAQLS